MKRKRKTTTRRRRTRRKSSGKIDWADAALTLAAGAAGFAAAKFVGDMDPVKKAVGDQYAPLAAGVAVAGAAFFALKDPKLSPALAAGAAVPMALGLAKITKMAGLVNAFSMAGDDDAEYLDIPITSQRDIDNVAAALKLPGTGRPPQPVLAGDLESDPLGGDLESDPLGY